MNSQIKIFNNPQFGEIRTAQNDETGEPLFCLLDLCKSLNLTNARVVAQRLDEDEVRKLNLGGQVGETNFVTESGMYTVILRSDSPIAKPMQKWVTKEVLPSIRKHGAYMTEKAIEDVISDPDSFIKLLTELKKEREEKRSLQRLAEVQAPVVDYANKVLSSTTSHTATTIAAQFNMSATVLNDLLLMAKFLRHTGKEYSLASAYHGRDLVETITTTYLRSNGELGTSISIRYTEKGRKAIYEIIERAKKAGVIIPVNGRYFINKNYKKSEPCTK